MGSGYEISIDQLLEAALQSVLVLSFAQAGHQCFQGEKHDRAPCFHRFDARGNSQDLDLGLAAFPALLAAQGHGTVPELR